MSAAAPASQRVLVVTGLAAEARIAAGRGVETIACGSDLQRLARAIEAALAPEVVGIASFGIAGALDEALPPGTCIVGHTVLADGERMACDERWTEALARALPHARRGVVLGTHAIVAEAGVKRSLRHATAADVVDTESHVVAGIARAHGLAFVVLRAVSDPVQRSLPPAARVPLRADGRVALRAVWRSIVRGPGQIPALVRTARDASAALAALSEGRRRLGPGLHHPDLRELLLDVA